MGARLEQLRDCDLCGLRITQGHVVYVGNGRVVVGHPECMGDALRATSSRAPDASARDARRRHDDAETRDRHAVASMPRPVARIAILPIPPSANNLWANVPGRGRVRTDSYRAWLAEAGWAVRLQGIRPMAGYAVLTLRAGITRRRRDVDNLLKPTCDLLVHHGIIEDDSRIAEIMARWDRDVPEGYVVISLRRTFCPEARPGSGHRHRDKTNNMYCAMLAACGRRPNMAAITARVSNAPQGT